VRPKGTSGTWSTTSGASDGYERWEVDLAPYAGRQVELSITLAGPDPARTGVFVDDVTLTTGSGTTSFEDDGDVLDGWTVAGPPPGSAANADD